MDWCPPAATKPNASASIKQLEQRINQLEQELQQIKSPGGDADSKTPAGPLRSLTLRIGTEDDRLRMYWADGQTSNLICSQEGKGCLGLRLSRREQLFEAGSQVGSTGHTSRRVREKAMLFSA